jgi:hypothetical protein
MRITPSQLIRSRTSAPAPTGSKPKPKPRAVPRRKKRVDPMQQPYDLTTSPYTTRQSFENEVNRVAGSQIQPQQDEINRQIAAMQSGSDRRQQQLSGWYNWARTGNQGAMDAASQALAQLAGANAQGGQESRDALSAAIGGTQGQQNQLVSNLGGQATDTGQGAALQAGSVQNAASLSNLLGSQFGSSIAGMAGRGNEISLGGIEASQDESARRRGEEETFSSQLRDLSGQLPGLRSQARQTLTESEMNRQNQMFQQYLSEKQLGLSAQNQSFQQWLAKKQLSISGRQQTESERQGRAQRSVAQQQLQLDAAKVAADSAKIQQGDDSEQAKQRAERYRNGAAMINEYLKPLKNEAGKNGDLRHNPQTKKTLW